MHLEDHLGDILRKARAMSGVSAAVAAAAARVTEAELARLEAGGQIVAPVNLAALAPLLGLHPAKLVRLAGGWLPDAPHPARWRELRQFSTTEHDNEVHCYLAWDGATREAAVFDAGWNAGPVLDAVAKERLQLKHVFITHTHPDHMGGLPQLRECFPSIQVHTDSKSAPPRHRNRRDDCIPLGALRITNRDTPGHAEDGVTYLIAGWPGNRPQVAIVGDAIFAGSIGRGNQSWDLARQKVRAHILSLPSDTLICPGHGPLTTVAQEKEHNPFF
jgi:hydroxyacylglutathione hydrolase